MNGTKGVSYFIPLTDCGNLLRETDGYIHVSNAIIVQKHRTVETDSDIIQNISCELPVPESIDVLEYSHESHPISYKNDTIESWMEFYTGQDILGVDVPNKLLVGDEFKIVVHLKSDGVYSDLRVERCWVHDEETVSTSEDIIEVFDDLSCHFPDWIKGFNSTRDFKNFSDLTVIGAMKAFKFLHTKDLHFTCSVQACRQTCIQSCDTPESEMSSSLERLKRSNPDSEKSLLERNRLMKATIKALKANMLDRNRERLLENDQIFSKRASEIGNIPVVDYPVGRGLLLDIDDSTDSTTSEDSWDGAYHFNLTNNLVVFTDHDFNFRRESCSNAQVPTNCVPKVRFVLLSATLSFIAFSLILACIGLVLYIRKEKKKHVNDHLLLYNLY